MIFKEITREMYEVFQKDHVYRNYLNTVEAHDLKAMSGWRIVYVGVFKADILMGATVLSFLPIMKCYQYASAQRGFLIDYRNQEVFVFFIKELKTYLKKARVLYLHVDPYVLYQERDIHGEVVKDGFSNKDILDALKQQGFKHLGFRIGISDIYRERWMFTLSLENKSEEEVLQNMHQQAKRSIHKTLRDHVLVREMKLEELDLFVDIMKHTSERRAFIDRGKTYYENFFKAYKDKATLLLASINIEEYLQRLYQAQQQEQASLQSIEQKILEDSESKKLLKKKRVCEENLRIYQRKIEEACILQKKYGVCIPLAAAIFMKAENELTYLFSGAYDDCKKFGGPYALQWEMIRYAIKHQYKRYNFYGISGDFRKDAKDYGVYEFKKGFDGCVEELIGDCILPIRKFVFAFYRKLKKNRF
ncbi:MAG: peptidoglycan bridge formation glycyltransferase FemA/FemB family protein [Breznakia sp.]